MSPRNKQQWSTFKSDKKALILNTALEQFAISGFHQTTMNQIAGEAGISKGLIYTYFNNKEDLLNQIIDKAITDIYSHFDSDRDGYLTEEEFEVFIRNVTKEINQNKTIWRLFFQLLMQRDVRKFFPEINPPPEFAIEDNGYRTYRFIAGIQNTVEDYFKRKQAKKPPGYNPSHEMDLFVYTFKGFILTTVFQDGNDDELFMNSVNLIIQTFK